MKNDINRIEEYNETVNLCEQKAIERTEVSCQKGKLIEQRNTIEKSIEAKFDEALVDTKKIEIEEAQLELERT